MKEAISQADLVAEEDKTVPTGTLRSGKKSRNRPTSDPSPTRTLLGEGALYAMATAAPMITGVAVTPFVTRTLGAQEYGLVSLGLSILQIAAVLLALGLPASVTRHAILEKSGASGASGLVVMGAGGAGILALIGIATARSWGSWLPFGGDAYVLVAATAAAAGIAVSTTALAHLRALSKVRLFLVVALCVAWVPALLGLATISLQDRSADAYLTALAVGQCTVGLSTLLVVRFISPPRFSIERTRSALRIGLPTVPHQLAMVAATSLIVIIAAREVGTADVGQLQLAVLIGSVPIIVIGAFNNSWAPMVYRATSSERVSMISRTTNTMTWLAAALATGAALLAPIVLGLVAPPELRSIDSDRAAAIVAASAPMMVLYLANIHMVFVSGRTAWLALTTPVSVIIGCTCALTTHRLVPGAGIWVYALMLPIFHGIQIAMAAWMRRRAGTPQLNLWLAVPQALAGVLTCLIVAAVAPGTWWRIAGAGLIVIGALVAAIALRARQEGGG
ncbi:lipopolysaccharide biosynthesis protein [Pengzhenrongella sp.]|uniref:lipopolysaccharide biosynthesis protein n=1 Tax=Pengzhenrongella sp. TaxID=2888820 RepID=UPI002F9522EC